MPNLIESVSIPSTTTGELYDIRAYDDGSVSCSCPFGSRRGLMAPEDRTCRHACQYRTQKAFGWEGERLPPAPDIAVEYRIDAARWVQRLCHIHSPVAYLHDIVLATLKEDERQKSLQFRPKPLRVTQRSVLEQILVVLTEIRRENESPAGSGGRPADVIAHQSLGAALRLRLPREEKSNKEISREIHTELREAE